MSFEPRIYTNTFDADSTFNLLPWIVIDELGNRRLSGSRMLTSSWTPPAIAELTKNQLTALLTDGDTRIAWFEPVYTPSGILYSVVWQDRILPSEERISREQE